MNEMRFVFHGPPRPRPQLGAREQARTVLHNLRRLVALIWREGPWLMLAMVGLNLAHALLPVVQLLLTKVLVDAATLAIQQGPAHLPQALRWLAIQTGVILLQNALFPVGNLIRSHLQQRVSFRLELEVVAKAQRLPLTYFDRSDFFDQIQRARSGMGFRGVGLVDEALNIGQAMVTVASYLVLLGRVHWLLAAAVVLVAAPSFWANLRFGQERFWQMRAQTPLSRRAGYFSSLLTGRESAKEIRVFGLAEHLLARWRALFWQQAGEQLALQNKQSWLGAGLNGGGSLLGAGASAFMLWLAAGGRLTLGDYVALGGATVGAQGRMRQASDGLARMYEHALFTTDLYAFLGLPEEETALDRAGPDPGAGDDGQEGAGGGNGPGTNGGAVRRPVLAAPNGRSGQGPVRIRVPGPGARIVAPPGARIVAPPGARAAASPGAPPEPGRRPGALLPFPGLRQGIAVHNLTFAYPGHRRPVLHDISFTIRPGERVAIVGENGAGKTTLVKCLLGLYLPRDGSITYDGVDIRDLDPVDLRRHVTAIFQDFVRYQLTARENIGYGRVERLDDEEALLDAAVRGGADEVLARLPRGLDTEVGPTFFGGHELSYGQWQKLALSRAFFRDADVIALDEPTAALDPRAEAAVFERFARLAAGKTALLISHRLGTCRSADRIVVLQDGRLVEQGAHAELMDRGGEYARLFELQARWYQ